MSKKLGKDEQRLQNLEQKFTDIKAIRERIIAESTDISNVLKNQLARKKAMSPDVLTKNIKSISSFLDNFNRMIMNLSTKLGSLTQQLQKTKQMGDQITAVTKSL